MDSTLIHKHNWQNKFISLLQLLCKSIVLLSLLAAVADVRQPPAWGSLEFHATPMAHPKLTKSLLSLVGECHENQQLRVGINAAYKALEKEPASEFVVLGADSDCDSLIEEVVEIAQNKCVPYVFVPSCEDLGKCCWSVYDERFENLFGVTIVSKNDSLINDKITSAKAEIKNLTMVYQKPLKLEASPVSTGNLTLKLYEFVAIALDYHQLERGVEEVTNVVSSNRAEFVVLAVDVKPFRTVEDCIRAAHKKNVPYIFMPSKKALGQALQMKSPLFAAVVVRLPGSRIQKEIEMVKKEIIELHQS